MAITCVSCVPWIARQSTSSLLIRPSTRAETFTPHRTVSLPVPSRGKNDISNRILLCGPCNKRESNQLTLSGLLRNSKKAKWMHDRAKANQARELAQKRYEKLRDASPEQFHLANC
ncbi:MAG: hypothetical protein M2R45_03581 [Verrucomicrobia subdivision 3 bacterium]|nr:hypothetical protein [Limisphaerales bacterium]MCS1414786.1 hypothetical protein [Limisphaerales bacterium]